MPDENTSSRGRVLRHSWMRNSPPQNTSLRDSEIPMNIIFLLEENKMKETSSTSGSIVMIARKALVSLRTRLTKGLWAASGLSFGSAEAFNPLSLESSGAAEAPNINPRHKRIRMRYIAWKKIAEVEKRLSWSSRKFLPHRSKVFSEELLGLRRWSAGSLASFCTCPKPCGPSSAHNEENQAKAFTWRLPTDRFWSERLRQNWIEDCSLWEIYSAIDGCAKKFS